MEPPSLAPPGPKGSSPRWAVAGAGLQILALITTVYLTVRMLGQAQGDLAQRVRLGELIALAPLAVVLFGVGRSLPLGRGLTLASIALVLYGVLFVMLAMVALGPPDRLISSENVVARLGPLLVGYGIACVALTRALGVPPPVPTESVSTPHSPVL